MQAAPVTAARASASQPTHYQSSRETHNGRRMASQPEVQMDGHCLMHFLYNVRSTGLKRALQGAESLAKDSRTPRKQGLGWYKQRKTEGLSPFAARCPLAIVHFSRKIRDYSVQFIRSETLISRKFWYILQSCFHCTLELLRHLNSVFEKEMGTLLRWTVLRPTYNTSDRNRHRIFWLEF